MFGLIGSGASWSTWSSGRGFSMAPGFDPLPASLRGLAGQADDGCCGQRWRICARFPSLEISGLVSLVSLVDRAGLVTGRASPLGQPGRMVERVMFGRGLPPWSVAELVNLVGVVSGVNLRLKWRRLVVATDSPFYCSNGVSQASQVSQAACIPLTWEPL